jgi:tetratricopeptide (TPR) repeat protein
MFKKYFVFILVALISSNISYSASSGSGDGNQIKIDNFKKASSLIKQAKKYEKKGKIQKAKKKFNKALEYLLKANKEKPNQPDTLNYLGFASRKTGNFIVAENYYLKGLSLDPNHVGINEYLGELYLETNRTDKAKERLKVLESCMCEEYNILKSSIELGKSNY